MAERDLDSELATAFKNEKMKARCCDDGCKQIPTFWIGSSEYDANHVCGDHVEDYRRPTDFVYRYDAGSQQTGELVREADVHVKGQDSEVKEDREHAH